MTPAIEARKLVKAYPGDVRALNGLSFAVEEGSIFALLGPNGAGKSTTIKILTTLSRPDEGGARVAGMDVLGEPQAVRKVIGVVAQRSGVDRDANGCENLTLQGQLYGLRGRALKARVTELLERFGLADAAGRLVRAYSGGMQRRLEVAMGLVHGPQVLFLDEPTRGLDPEARAVMWDEIARLAGDDGLTILLTTHYLEEADRLARRLAIVDRGRVVAEGSPEQLKGELRGDAVHVELVDPETNGHVELVDPETNGRVHHALARIESVSEVSIDGRLLSARVDHSATAVPAVLAALEGEGVPVASVTVARPSLDDVYLRYAGRAFSEADKKKKEEVS